MNDNDLERVAVEEILKNLIEEQKAKVWTRPKPEGCLNKRLSSRSLVSTLRNPVFPSNIKRRQVVGLDDEFAGETQAEAEEKRKKTNNGHKYDPSEDFIYDARQYFDAKKYRKVVAYRMEKREKLKMLELRKQAKRLYWKYAHENDGVSKWQRNDDIKSSNRVSRSEVGEIDIGGRWTNFDGMSTGSESLESIHASYRQNYSLQRLYDSTQQQHISDYLGDCYSKPDLSHSRNRLSHSRIRLSHSRDRLSHSRNRLSHSRDRLLHSRDRLSHSNDRLSHSNDRLSHSSNRLSHSRDRLSHSRDRLLHSGDRLSHSNSRDRLSHSRDRLSHSRDRLSHSRIRMSHSEDRLSLYMNQHSRSEDLVPTIGCFLKSRRYSDAQSEYFEFHNNLLLQRKHKPHKHDKGKHRKHKSEKRRHKKKTEKHGSSKLTTLRKHSKRRTKNRTKLDKCASRRKHENLHYKLSTAEWLDNSGEKMYDDASRDRSETEGDVNWSRSVQQSSLSRSTIETLSINALFNARSRVDDDNVIYDYMSDGDVINDYMSDIRVTKDIRSDENLAELQSDSDNGSSDDCQCNDDRSGSENNPLHDDITVASEGNDIANGVGNYCNSNNEEFDSEEERHRSLVRAVISDAFR